MKKLAVIINCEKVSREQKMYSVIYFIQSMANGPMGFTLHLLIGSLASVDCISVGQPRVEKLTSRGPGVTF